MQLKAAKVSTSLWYTWCGVVKLQYIDAPEAEHLATAQVPRAVGNKKGLLESTKGVSPSFCWTLSRTQASLGCFGK